MADVPAPAGAGYPQPAAQMGMPQTIDLMTRLGQLQLMANQNQLFQQQNQAHAAMGPIMQSSVRPDGTLDIPGAILKLSMDPRTAFLAPEIATKLLQNQNTQLEATGKRLENAKKQFDAMGSIALGTLAQLQELDPSDPQIYDKARKAWLQGITSAVGMEGPDGEPLLGRDAALKMISAMPKDYGSMLSTLKMNVARSEVASKNIDSVLGRVTNQDLGGFVQPLLQSALFGTRSAGPAMVKTAGPDITNSLITHNATAEEAARYGVQEGAPIQQPRGTAVPVLTGQGPNGLIMGMPPDRGPGGASPPATGTPGAALPGIAGISPQRAKVLEEQAGAFTDYQKDLNKQVGHNNDIVRMITTLEPELAKMRTGGWQETRQGLAQQAQGLSDVLAQAGIIKPETGKDLIQKIAGGDYATGQYAMKQLLTLAVENSRASLGAGKITNLEFGQLSAKANPNIDMDEQGIRKIFNFIKWGAGLKEAEQHLASMWAESGKPPQQFAAWYQSQLERAGISQTGSKTAQRLAANTPRTTMDEIGQEILSDYTPEKFGAKPNAGAKSSAPVAKSARQILDEELGPAR